MKTKITISVDRQILVQFRDHCEQNGMKMSSRINKLMEKSLNEPMVMQE